MLTEGDDPQDPIADAARGILDGHIVLSRELAEAGHYPAIDVETLDLARDERGRRPRAMWPRRAALRQLLARYNKARDLIQLGAYAPGHDAELDLAVRLQPQMSALLQQDMHERATLAGEPATAGAHRAGHLTRRRRDTMTPASLQSLRTLLEHAERERDAALAVLRDAEDSARRAEAQADQLDDYRGQYRERWMAQFRQSASSTTCCTATMASCSAWTRRSTSSASNARRSTNVSPGAPAVAGPRAARGCGAQAIERRLQALQKQADRREQKQTDEAAQRAVWPARLAADPH